jgi:hypothetical protein
MRSLGEGPCPKKKLGKADEGGAREKAGYFEEETRTCSASQPVFSMSMLTDAPLFRVGCHRLHVADRLAFPAPHLRA